MIGLWSNHSGRVTSSLQKSAEFYFSPNPSLFQRSSSFRLSSSRFFWALEVVNLEMKSQHCAFIILPHTWKQTPGKAPDPSFFPPPVNPPLLRGIQGFLLFVQVALCLLPCPAQAAWFRVGVVGPWGCDPLFAKALPSVAAQLAVNRINRDPSLSYAVTFNYAILQVQVDPSFISMKIMWIKPQTVVPHCHVSLSQSNVCVQKKTFS